MTNDFDDNHNSGIDNIRALPSGELQPVPHTPPPVAGVPEPATWALMLFGFGAAGAALRRRAALARRRDPHLQPLGIDGADRGAQTLDALGLQLNQHRADIEPAQSAEMALQPVAARRQHRGGQRLRQAGPVAAHHAQDQRRHARSEPWTAAAVNPWAALAGSHRAANLP